jgi:hypothetical protein
VLPLYADDAVLWGTLSPTVRADRAALRDYFVGAFTALPGLKVTFGEQLIRVYGTTAVNTGYYTLSYLKDGETKSWPARYKLHLCQERRSLANCRSSFLGDAGAPEVVKGAPSGSLIEELPTTTSERPRVPIMPRNLADLMHELGPEFAARAARYDSEDQFVAENLR